MGSDRSVHTGVAHPNGRGEDPLFHFTRVYLLFLQGLFAQFPSGCYRWTDNEDDSEIAITDQAPIPRARIEQRPGLVTMRGPAQYANLSLDNVRNVDARTGMKERTDLVACTMTINCLAKEGVEAQRVAWIVMRHLRSFKTLIQRSGIHKVGDNVSVGPETPAGALVQPEPDTELVNVVVQSPFFFQWTERVTPTDAPLVQNIEAHMAAGILPPASISTKIWQREVQAPRPTIRGRPVNGVSVPIDRPIELVVKT
jgi:hypothetical protein